jgi:hypothetical protein
MLISSKYAMKDVTMKSDLELRAARMSAVCAFKLNDIIDTLRPLNTADLPITNMHNCQASSSSSSSSTGERRRHQSSNTSDYASMYGINARSCSSGAIISGYDFNIRTWVHFWNASSHLTQFNKYLIIIVASLFIESTKHLLLISGSITGHSRTHKSRY